MRAISKSNRFQYIDAAKGIGMLAIIAGHMGYQTIERIVFTFHVPIFFFICGYLFKPKRSVDRISHLIKPYLFTAFALTVLTDIRELIKLLAHRDDFISVVKNTYDYIKATIYGSGVRTDFMGWDLKPIGAIWFLLALLISLLLFDLIMRVSQKNKIASIGLAIAVIAAGYISSKYVWLPLSIQSAAVGLLIVYCGYLLKNSRLYFGNYILTFCGLTVWGGAIYASVKYGNMSMAEGSYPLPIINFLGCICASYTILSVLSIVEKKINTKYKIWNWLCELGKESTAVLCVHLIEIRVVPWHIVKHNNRILAFATIYFAKIIIATITAYFIKWYKSRSTCI